MLAVLATACHQWQFWHSDRLETDLFALLPIDERDAGIERAMRTLADNAARQVLVLVGGSPKWDDTRRAAERFDAEWRRLDPELQVGANVGKETTEQALNALRPWRDRLLTPAQIQRLQIAAEADLAQQALEALYRPGLMWRMSEWSSDPLSLAPQWWAERAAVSPLRPRDGWLTVQDVGRHWVVLAREIRGSAFSMGNGRPHGDAIDSAIAALQHTQPDIQILRAGIPLIAEAAAAQGAAEVNLIGWGSLAAVLILVWLGFRSLRPVICVTLSLVVGTAMALTVTALLFDKVHMVTMVFGASLVGVAEDFGIHFFASRASHPDESPDYLMRRLRPGLLLALITSVLGYAVMALVPFPGLRQMAVFSSVGLAAAFFTVECWFPTLAGSNVVMTPLAKRISRSLRWRPRPLQGKIGFMLTLVVTTALAPGVWSLRVRDDVRQLQASPTELLQQQRQVQELLRLPSPGQFFLVTAEDEDELLRREESLTTALAPLVAQGRIGGWSALSDWVPSGEKQRYSAQLTARVESAVLQIVGRSLGERFERPNIESSPLTVSTFLSLPVAQPLGAQWLGKLPGTMLVGSVVLVYGLSRVADLPALANTVVDLAGVHWVDRPTQISQLLARYRLAMSAVLVLGFVLVGAALWIRFRRRAWRAWLPSVLACVFTLSVLGWLGEPVQLFNVLALLILLGIGVDYGIFLVEHQADGSAWLAVVLGAASTLLSFGLLALSGTPALRAFGLTMALGVASVVLLSPLFLLRDDKAIEVVGR